MISIKVRGLVEQLRALESARDAIASAQSQAPRECVTLAAGVDVKQANAAFASQGEKSGGKWAPLSKRYAEEKRLAVGKKLILQRTGEMRKSLVNQSDAHHIARANGRTVELGTSHPVAAKHQTGGTFTEQVPESMRRTTRAAYSGGRFAGRVTVLRRTRAHSRRYTLPARPVVRKTEAQFGQLRLAIAKGVYLFTAGRSGGRVGLVFRKKAGLISPDPRL